MAVFEILCIVTVIVVFLYYYSASKHKFWKNHGVQGPDPVFCLGNFKDILFDRLSLGEYAKDMYNKFVEESMVGIYFINTPILILRDPKVIKDVLIKDFNTFDSRGLPVHEKVEPLSQNLVKLEAKRWRPLRKRLSPVFTSGKIKEMFHFLLENSNHIEKYLEKIVSQNEPLDCRELTTKFTMDVIGSCAFGINVNAFTDEDNDFLRMGQKIFDQSFRKLIRFKIRDTTPWLFDFLEPLFKEKEIDDFFTNLILNTMEQRKKQNVVRHNFVDFLRFIKENPEEMNNIELTDSLIAAQAFIFFTAGFETSSTTMSNALYELALNPEVQNKLRKEIQEHLKQSDGKLTYEIVKNMRYLHKVFQETLRKYPPVMTLGRKSSKEYTFSGTNITIPKDTNIWIPVYGIHHDPTYYPNPDIFDPERFNDEEVEARHPMVYLPFGDGPRNCIGERFAVFQMNVGLIKILQNYSVHVCEKTPIPYVINPKSFIIAPKGDIFLKFSRMY